MTRRCLVNFYSTGVLFDGREQSKLEDQYGTGLVQHVQMVQDRVDGRTKAVEDMTLDELDELEDEEDEQVLLQYRLM